MRITRAMHEAGVKRLDVWFGWSPGDATNPRGGGVKGAERRKRKLARKARKRNRR